MRIRYETTLEDLLAFSLHLHQNSPTLRRTRRWAAFGLAAMMIGLGLIASEITRAPIVLWVGVGGAAVIALSYPRIYRRNVKRLSSRLYAEG